MQETCRMSFKKNSLQRTVECDKVADVYIYIPATEVEKAVECGLKLSVWYDRMVSIGGERKRCIPALLNPKDDMRKFISSELKCLKIEIDARNTFVSDGYLYEMGKKHPQVLEMYEESIIPLQDYIFGLYRLPVCLITTTILSEQISIMDKRIGSPVLFSSSEELYIHNIIEMNREMNDGFNDSLLYCYLCRLVETGEVVKIEDRETGMAVFINRDRNRKCLVKIPDEKLPEFEMPANRPPVHPLGKMWVIR